MTQRTNEVLCACANSCAKDKEIARLREALKPFAEPHAMGDNYVKFAPRLIEAARRALT